MEFLNSAFRFEQFAVQDRAACRATDGIVRQVSKFDMEDRISSYPSHYAGHALTFEVEIIDVIPADSGNAG